MAAIHEFKCDGCDRRVKANYNGEHYLPPQGWVVIYDPNMGEKLDCHLCVDCKNGALYRPRAEIREAKS